MKNETQLKDSLLPDPDNDPATDYAVRVVAGEIVAGPHVRNACQRHLDDLCNAHERGWKWDPARVDHILSFYREVLVLNGGEFEGIPYEPLPWQAFILGSIFGWVDSLGYRRFKVSYVETGKGSGKSPLAAGIGIYGLVADNEPRAEIYSAATKKDQAMILFRDAVAMRDLSPMLSSRIKKSGTGKQAWNLAYLDTGSFFCPLSSDESQSGPRPHIALIDEVHEHKTANVINMIRMGFKFRKQPHMMMITNSGTDKRRVCWEYHEYGANVSAGMIEDDTFFAFVCGIDEDDDPFKDESCWEKANPSIEHGIPGYDYVRQQVREAEGLPSKKNTVKRLNFCVWTESDKSWLGKTLWMSAADPGFDKSTLAGRACVGGLDLSSTRDLTSLVLAFEPIETDPVTRLLPFFWIPDYGIERKSKDDKVPYSEWRDSGFIFTTPGKAVNKLKVIAKLAELSGLYDIIAVAFDRWRIEDFNLLLDGEGLELNMVPFGQGYQSMSPAIEEFERLLLSDDMKHNNNPCFTWNAANAVTVEDPAGNKKLSKEISSGRIDGMVAAVMAVGIAGKYESDSIDDFLSNPVIA